MAEAEADHGGESRAGMKQPVKVEFELNSELEERLEPPARARGIPVVVLARRLMRAGLGAEVLDTRQNPERRVG